MIFIVEVPVEGYLDTAGPIHTAAFVDCGDLSRDEVDEQLAEASCAIIGQWPEGSALEPASITLGKLIEMAERFSPRVGLL